MNNRRVLMEKLADVQELNLGDNLPWGVCSQCLKKMATGAAYDAVRLPGGQYLVHAYCQHREAGATLLIRPGRPKRWRILVPIDAIEWAKYLEIQAPMFAGAFSALDPSAPGKSDMH
jgi:hypothetical protein